MTQPTVTKHWRK